MRRAQARLCVSCFKRFGFILPLNPTTRSSVCDDKVNMTRHNEVAYGRLTVQTVWQYVCNNAAENLSDVHLQLISKF